MAVFKRFSGLVTTMTVVTVKKVATIAAAGDEMKKVNRRGSQNEMGRQCETKDQGQTG